VTTGASYRVFRSARKRGGQFLYSRDSPRRNMQVEVRNPVTDTGYDFADFLLGFPATGLLCNPVCNFLQLSCKTRFDFFGQDDWRFRSNLSFNLGSALRIQRAIYRGKKNQIANLDVAPGFNAAAPVLPGQAGPFDGIFPASLVRPDRKQFRAADRNCLEASEANGGADGLRNQLQPGPIRHIDSKTSRFQPPFANTATNTTDVTGFLGAGPADFD